MLDLTRFKVLTFDCYGTMIDWETGIFSALRPILARMEKRLPTPPFWSCTPNWKSRRRRENFCVIEMSCKSVVRGFGERLGFLPTDAEARSLPDSIANWQPFPDTVEALRKLKARYQLAVISNVDDDLFASTAPKLGVAFDQVITAQQAGCYKPCMRIFELAEERMRRKPRALASRRTKHLSRRNSRAVIGHCDRLGKPAFTPPRRRSCQSRRRKARPGSPQPKHLGQSGHQSLFTTNVADQNSVIPTGAFHPRRG